RLGNRVTALRWRKILAELGHRVVIRTGRPAGGYDVLLAIHARHSADVVRWSRETHPLRPIVLALTGTDLYRDILHDASAQRSLALADALVVLQDRAALALPREYRGRVRVIRQSADRVTRKQRRSATTFDVAFVAHLRAEKDPLRAALAARTLPEKSKLRILHAGRALGEEFRIGAEAEQRSNPRYQWLGEISPAASRALIARSQLLVLTSVMEGGANVLGEAIVSGIPVIAARIPATVSALGPRYPGLFAVGDTTALARLFRRAEEDAKFLATLTRETRARRPLFSRTVEKAAWRALLRELSSR
ncbi:MAG: glycosyl transferase, partial [Myxococcaceae bacterium]|nr:glycosyl transferase [Myxococcaceae bacterium]